MKPQNIGQANLKLVFEQFLHEDDLTVAYLSQKLNLSRTAVMKIVNLLLEQGILQRTGKGGSTAEGGKKPDLFSLNPTSLCSLVVWLRESVLEIEQRDLRCRMQQRKTFLLTEPDQYQTVISEVGAELEQFVMEYGIQPERLVGVVVCADGVIDSEAGVIRIPAHYAWRGQLPICSDLAARIPWPVPVYVGSMVTFASYRQQLRFPNERLVVLLIDGYVGSCVIGLSDDPVMTGFFSEIVHMIVDPRAGEVCEICGRRGCFESVVRPQIIVKNYRKHATPQSFLWNEVENGTLHISHILDSAGKGDDLAVQLVDELVSYFETMIHNIVVMIHPQRIVIGGKMNVPGEYLELALQRISKKEASINYNGNLEISYGAAYSDFAEGAAHYALQQYLNPEVL